jgi:hypothetical protein
MHMDPSPGIVVRGAGRCGAGIRRKHDPRGSSARCIMAEFWETDATLTSDESPLRRQHSRLAQLHE